MRPSGMVVGKFRLPLENEEKVDRDSNLALK